VGKKTDAFLKGLSAKGEACAQTAASLTKVLAVWPAIDKEWDKWEPEMIQLPNWEDHPYAKKRIEVWQMGKDLAAKLKNDTNALNNALDDFRRFVHDKEKAKTFKSKTSLPSAKQAIKMYDDALTYLTELAQTGRRAFH